MWKTLVRNGSKGLPATPEGAQQQQDVPVVAQEGKAVSLEEEAPPPLQPKPRKQASQPVTSSSLARAQSITQKPATEWQEVRPRLRRQDHHPS